MSEDENTGSVHPRRSFNLMDGQLSAKQVISIVVALLSLAAAIFGGTIAIVRSGVGLEYTVKGLQADVALCAKKENLDSFVAKVETSSNASAAERAKFYVTHSGLECDMTSKNKKHVHCKLIFPVTDDTE